MGDLSFDVDPEGLACHGRPADLSLMVTCGDLRRRGNTISGMRIHVHVMRDGRPLGTGNGVLSCASAAAYRRLRGERGGVPHRGELPLPVPPPLVGRDRSTDVVSPPTADPQVWEVRSDLRHPVLFDHEVDHLPGMVLVEAMRQAACLATRLAGAAGRHRAEHAVREVRRVRPAVPGPGRGGPGRSRRRRCRCCWSRTARRSRTAGCWCAPPA